MSVTARPPRRLATLLAVLCLAAGCADLLEVQVDPIGDRRPSTLVRRLRAQTDALKDTYRQQRKGGYGPIDFFIDELIKSGESMDQDLAHQGGRFNTPLARARDAGINLDPLIQGRSQVSPAVQQRWWAVRDTLRHLLQEFSALGIPGIYEQEATPTRTIPVVSDRSDGYDATFAADQVQTGFARAMKAWETAPARKTAGAWAKSLDAELVAFSTELGQLARVKTGRKAEVQPVAVRLAGRRDRIDELVGDHKTELPRDLVEAWSSAGFWLGTLTQ